MSKALQAKIDELFEATKDLMSFEEIKSHCDRFNGWVNQQSYSEKSLGTLFSRYGLYSKFRDVKLEQGLNADLIPRYDAQGKVKGHELKHFALLLCGLNKEQWDVRNATTRSTDRIDQSNEQPREIDPDVYLHVVGKLLASSDPHELAVGLIAATGRRPNEILARGSFEAIEGKAYHVMFAGQSKKRGDVPVFEIATLYPAEYVISLLAKLRKEASTKTLLKEVAAQFPKSITRQNVEIDNRRNGSLNRVVRSYFGDKGDTSPVLAFRYGEQQDNNKALRAAYATLATERDCKGGTGAKILHASRLLGHLIRKVKDDRNLMALGTSAGYLDYSVSKPVPFPQMPKVAEKEKPTSVRVARTDFEEINKLQQFWKLPNQQSVVSRLIERQEKNVELGRLLQEKTQQLQEAKAQLRDALEKINQLENGKVEMSQVQPQAPQAAPSQVEESLEAKIERLIEEKLNTALSKFTAVQPSTQVVESKPVKAPVKQEEVIDWESKSNADLWSTKIRGASEEKIQRSFNAICLYNDTIATGDNDRLAITNQALRELSGVNGLLIGDWIKSHADEVITHNSKYGMQPLAPDGSLAKDKEGNVRTDSYYNKRHGSEKISKLLSLVREQLLKDETIKTKN